MIHDQKTYAISYVEQESSEISSKIFKSYEDLKTFYMNLDQVETHDQERIIDIRAYEISLETNSLNENEFIDISMTYINGDIIINIS